MCSRELTFMCYFPLGPVLEAISAENTPAGTFSFFPDIVFLKIQPLEHSLFWRKKRLAFAHCTARSARASDAILPLFTLSTVHLLISHTFSPMSTQSGFSHFSKFTFISKQCLRAIHGGTLVSDRLMMVRGAFKATTFRDIREDHQTGEILLSLM